MSQDSYTRSFLVNRSPLRRAAGYLDNCSNNAYLDSLIRHDYRRPPNCSSKSKPCGESCIPKNHKCRIDKKELARIVATHENQIRNLPKEEARAIDPDTGELVLRIKGDETSVGFTDNDIAKLKGKILTHNHPNLGWAEDDPRAEGLGFSRADLEFAAIADLKEIRAVGRDYNYSLSPGMARQWDRRKIVRSYDRQFEKQYWSTWGKILSGNYARAEAEIHHDIVAGVAKDLGLTYRRERIKNHQQKTRSDFVGNLNCGPGTMPCGKACIPRGHNCNIRDRVQGKARSLANKAANKGLAYEKQLPVKYRRKIAKLQGKGVEIFGKRIQKNADLIGNPKKTLYQKGKEQIDIAYQEAKSKIQEVVSQLKQKIKADSAMSQYPEVAEIIAVGFGYPDEVLSAETRSDGAIQGQFFNYGRIFDYLIREDGLEYEYNTEETERVSEYCLGRLDGLGIRADSHNAYSSLVQAYGGEVRSDRKSMECRFGQCGGRCLRQGEKCRMKERLAGGMKTAKATAKWRSSQAKYAAKGANMGGRAGAEIAYQAAKDEGKSELQAQKERVKGAVLGASDGARVGRHVGTAKYVKKEIGNSFSQKQKERMSRVKTAAQRGAAAGGIAGAAGLVGVGAIPGAVGGAAIGAGGQALAEGVGAAKNAIKRRRNRNR